MGRIASVAAPFTSASVRTPQIRLTAVDALRGAIMVVMALDHVRDFVHAGAMTFSPEDLAQTTPLIFFTRWVTHICAPTFAFLAGVGAFLSLQRDGSKARLSRFLLTRGLWLIVLELTVQRLALNFTASLAYPILLMVLWALGVSMIALAGLIYLPKRVLAVLCLAVIALHNTLDGVQAAAFGAFGGVWNIAHQPGVFFVAGLPVLAGYPVLPWIAVMAAGFCFGEVFTLEPRTRRRRIMAVGIGAVAMFVVLRALNIYGDPVPWSEQTSPVFTVLSFLRATKYPPSLAFLLMTLGPSLLALAYLDRRQLPPDHPLVVIGRVPLFFYVVHFWTIHVICACLAWLRYGDRSFAFLFSPVPSVGGSRELFPEGFGYPLWVAYVVWLGVVVGLYPLCRWFAGVKARRHDWWLGYL